MALKPPPRLQSPDAEGSFTPVNPQPSPDNPSAGASPVPGESNPGAMEDASNILAITAAARRIANKYHNTVPEVQTINDAVQKLQMKITMAQPTAEVAAPPQ